MKDTTVKMKLDELQLWCIKNTDIKLLFFVIHSSAFEFNKSNIYIKYSIVSLFDGSVIIQRNLKIHHGNNIKEN